MSRSFALPLLGLALLAASASAQTTPTHKAATKKAANKPASKLTPRMPSQPTAAQRAAADPLRGTNDNGRGNSQYAAPGEPIISPADNGKNTPPYNGPAARKNTTIATPR